MIEYQIVSSADNINAPSNHCYFRVTTGETGLDNTVGTWGDNQEKTWHSTHLKKQAAQPGAAAKFLWQAAVETTFGEPPKWEMPTPHTTNVRVVGTLARAKPDEIREVKRASEFLLSCEQSGNGQLASFFAVYFVEQSFRLRAYENVNTLLDEIDISPLTEWSMIALLRSSFSARKYLPAWSRLLAAVHDKLQAEGKDTKKLLRGLNR
ncbi:hypothetical protein [Burkholderia ubonensis]|uniref:hypothetical protein n=1 Tax=Burkholderia ubonensis TaxID=101571 RepID=UPI0012FCB8FB|nr:hypothetical protein [Burkholderia ubonensis]